jgi:hypothetical protein
VANVYPAGSLVRESQTFTDLTTGNPTDPAVVKIQWEIVPNGTGSPGSITTWTYGGTGSVVKDSTGHYHADLDTTTGSGTPPGQWQGEWISPPGTGQTIGPWKWIVLPSEVH